MPLAPIAVSTIRVANRDFSDGNGGTECLGKASPAPTEERWLSNSSYLVDLDRHVSGAISQLHARVITHSTARHQLILGRVI